MLGSSDPLDFRHHDYKAMRKVRRKPYDPGGRLCPSQVPAPRTITCYDYHSHVFPHLTLLLIPELP